MPEINSNEEMITVKEAALILGVSRQRVNQLIHNKVFQVVIIEERQHISRKEIDHYENTKEARANAVREMSTERIKQASIRYWQEKKARREQILSDRTIKLIPIFIAAEVLGKKREDIEYIIRKHKIEKFPRDGRENITIEDFKKIQEICENDSSV